MKELEIKNAKIIYTKLGVAHTDHGILSFMIGLEGDGWGQGFGGLVLDTWDEKSQKRIPTNLASSLLLAIDELWELDWEKIVGIPCRAYGDFGHMTAIGDFTKDKWLWFDQPSMEFKVTSFKEIVS